jgi:CubicO group peptidase (beta-lactamase class C family)
MCTKYPVTSPFRTAVYSDGGFAVLGQVLARLTGKDYGEAIREILFEPLGLEGMSDKAPSGPSINAINRKIVDKNSSWGLDYPITAGQVSTSCSALALLLIRLAELVDYMPVHQTFAPLDCLY